MASAPAATAVRTGGLGVGRSCAAPYDRAPARRVGRCASRPSTCSAGGRCPTARSAPRTWSTRPPSWTPTSSGLQEVDRHQDRSRWRRPDSHRGRGARRGVVAGSCRRSTALPGAAWTPSTRRRRVDVDGPTYGVGLVSRLPVLSWQVRRFGPAPIGLPLLVPGRRGLTHGAGRAAARAGRRGRGAGRAGHGADRAPVVRARAGTCGSCGRSRGGRGRCRPRGCWSATSTCPARCPGW